MLPRHPPPASQIGAGRVASGNGENPLHGGCIGRVFAADPVSYRAPSEGCRRCCQRLRIGGVEGSRKFVQQVGFVASEIRLTRQHGHQVALGELLHRGQQLVAHSISEVPRIGVRRVVHHFQPE